ncbi:hypothetical protein [Sphingomonas sp. S-NIH.Pt15_0812]|jgi:hypothetical protein|nr:hypothetical protein [Sphingomonas sp. S-NIH.Pt15_0812]
MVVPLLLEQDAIGFSQAVIASAAKQSTAARVTLWIASLRSQ